MILYGVDGFGKSTFGTQAPNPIFLCSEEGTKKLEVARFPLAETYETVLAMLDELVIEKHDHKTLVIDSLDWLESMLVEHVCKRHGVDQPNKGDMAYGNGQ